LYHECHRISKQSGFSASTNYVTSIRRTNRFVTFDNVQFVYLAKVRSTEKKNVVAPQKGHTQKKRNEIKYRKIVALEE